MKYLRYENFNARNGCSCGVALVRPLRGPAKRTFHRGGRMIRTHIQGTCILGGETRDTGHYFIERIPQYSKDALTGLNSDNTLWREMKPQRA